jgi:hypothetical protein
MFTTSNEWPQRGRLELPAVDRMAAIGASCPFRLVLANVPSPNPQQPFAAGNNLLGQAVSRKYHQKLTKEEEYS